MNNIPLLFQHTTNDLQDALIDRPMDTLDSLRNLLLECVCSAFPQYKDRRPIKRQVKRTLLADLCVLGYGLANQSASREMDKVFAEGTSAAAAASGKPSDTCSSASSLAELLAVTAKLVQRVDTLEDEIRELKVKNADLEERLAAPHPNPVTANTVAAPDKRCTPSAPPLELLEDSQSPTETDSNVLSSAEEDAEAAFQPVETRQSKKKHKKGRGSRQGHHRPANQSSTDSQQPSQAASRANSPSDGESAIYVGNAHPSCTSDDLKDYVFTPFPIQCQCQRHQSAREQPRSTFLLPHCASRHI